METTFKYKGKIITTPNLEKKLKRMKLSIDNIEIIESDKKALPNNEVEDSNLKQVIVRSTKDNIRRICYIPKDYTPTIYELFKDEIWNSKTKTGVKDITEDSLMSMYYEKLI